MNEHFKKYKKAFKVTNVEIFAFIIGALLYWLFRFLGFETIAILCGGIGIIGFFIGMTSMQHLVSQEVKG